MNLDLFFYLSAFITIVLALAVSDMVQSIHRVLSARTRIRWHPLPLLAAVFVFLSVLSEFFSLWGHINGKSYSFFGLVGLMFCPTLIAIAACAVLPDDIPDTGLDLETFYFENRAYLYPVLLLAFAGDLARNAFEAAALGQRVEWIELLPIYALLLPATALLAWSRSRLLHYTGLALLLGLALLGYAGWTVELPAG